MFDTSDKVCAMRLWRKRETLGVAMKLAGNEKAISRRKGFCESRRACVAQVSERHNVNLVGQCFDSRDK
jgi:hypothetical protein